MKKTLFLMTALLASFLTASATDEVVVADVTVPQGETATINVELKNEQEFTAFQMQLTLPEGISFVKNKRGNPTFEEGERFDDHSLSSSAIGMFTCASFSLAPFYDSEGVLMSINVAAADDAEVGKTVKATLSNIEFTTLAAKRVQFDDITINITITAPTAIESLPDGSAIQSGEWYTVDGLKLTGKPTQPGIYIVDGKKVSIMK
jgi:hypothetical protein